MIKTFSEVDTKEVFQIEEPAVESSVSPIPEDTNTTIAETEENTIDLENAETAKDAYQAFLSGNETVVTAERFREDDDSYNMDGLLFGTYTLGELKEKIAEYERTEAVVRYAFLDCGQDGSQEMILRLESVDSSHNS